MRRSNAQELIVSASRLCSVLCLRRDFPGAAAVPLEQLHEVARRLHAEAALGAALPAIRSQFESLEAELGGCLAELGPSASSGTVSQVGAASQG